MLLIGSAKIKELRELLENYNENGTKFEIIKYEGLNVTALHNLESDAVAKALVKQIVREDPNLKSFFLSVKIVDENGNLV
jgi:hypothetical protein